MGWVGGKRVEGDWATEGANPDSLVEGDFGMSWAAYKLAGYTPEPAMHWSPMADYSAPAQVVYKDKVYEATAWIAHGTAPEALDTANFPGWDTLPQWKKNAELQKYPWKEVRELGAQTSTKHNPDGTNLRFTFNIISGFMVPTWPKTWQSRESKYGYYVPNKEFYADGKIVHSKIAVSWGREMPIYDAAPTDAAKEQMDSTKIFVQGYINQAFDEARKLGHELGNHTIDHMESNSPLPNKKGEPIASMAGATGMAYRDGFARWNSEGYDTSKVDKYGDEAKEFGQTDGNIWQYMGWEMVAGRHISKTAWKGAIKIGEEEITKAYGLSVANGNLFSFRAPRLEVNSAMHFALKESGYLYDCGQEEGYEYFVDGTNFLWPYTTDNGSPNVSWQRTIGEKMSIDSMPAGFWEIPVNAMIVPQDIRPAVYANHATIARAEAAKLGTDAPTAEDSTFWVNESGRVTGFDFNMFILWGMTEDQVVQTLEYNLDQRMKGNKAPMQIGCHTDYFTPIYDYATLRSDANKDTYGLCVVNGWNTWENRKAAWEKFVDYGISKGVYFYTGKQTIDYVKELAAKEKRGSDSLEFSNGQWEFFKTLNGTSTNKDTIIGDIDATVTISAAEGESYPEAGYGLYEDAGYFSGMTHIMFDYNITAPVKIRINTVNDGNFEVWLNSLKNNVFSGPIPLTAFHRDGDDTLPMTSINTAEIEGIEFVVLTAAEKEETHTIKISNIKIYNGGSVVATANDLGSLKTTAIALNGFNRDNLSLSVPTSGAYNINIYSLSGRVVGSFNNRTLTSGVNKIALNNLSSGIYLINIVNRAGNIQKSFKSMIR